METIVKYAIVALMAFGTLANVADVGKPRKPVDGGLAAFIVTVNVLIIAAILIYWD